MNPELQDWLKALAQLIESITRGAVEHVGYDRTDGGLVVSTVLTPDEGYETAVVDREGAHPVERYDNREEAEIGHRRWKLFAESGVGRRVFELGMSGAPDADKVVTLQGREECD